MKRGIEALTIVGAVCVAIAGCSSSTTVSGNGGAGGTDSGAAGASGIGGTSGAAGTGGVANAGAGGAADAGPCAAGDTRTIGPCGGCGDAVETCYAGTWSAPVCQHADCGPNQPCKTSLDCAKPLTCGNTNGELVCCYPDGTPCGSVAKGVDGCPGYCCSKTWTEDPNGAWHCG